MNPITDQALLDRLNGTGSAVTDPNTLAKLNASGALRAKIDKQIEADKAALDPTAGMSLLDKGIVGFGQAADRAWEGIKGLVPGYEESAQSKDSRAIYERTKDKLGPAATAGELAFDIAATAAPVAKGAQVAGNVMRMLPKAGQYLAAGNILPTALAGGATSAILDPTDRTGAAIGGALGGALGEGAGRALTKVGGGLFRGKNISQDAQDLIKAGVDVPLWKTTDSGLLRGMVERAKVFPVAGNILRAAEARGMSDVERKLMNEAMPMQYNGSAWLPGAPVKEGGEAGMQQLHSAFNDAYDTLYKGRSVPIDTMYNQAMADILRQTKGYHPGFFGDIQAAGREVDDLLRAGTEPANVRNSIAAQLQGAPRMSQTPGHAAVSTNNVKSAIDSLRTRIESAVRQGDMEKVGILKQMEGELLDLRNRGLPQEMADIGETLGKQYATYKQLQRANTAIGAKTQGFATPAHLLNAIKATDRTPGKSAFSEGNALNQKFVQSAKNVFHDTLPGAGPGTAEKLMMLGGLGLPFLAEDYAFATPAALALSTKTGRRILTGGAKGQETIRNVGSKYLTPALRSFGVAEAQD